MVRDFTRVRCPWPKFLYSKNTFLSEMRERNYNILVSFFLFWLGLGLCFFVTLVKYERVMIRVFARVRVRVTQRSL